MRVTGSMAGWGLCGAICWELVSPRKGIALVCALDLARGLRSFIPSLGMSTGISGKCKHKDCMKKLLNIGDIAGFFSGISVSYREDFCKRDRDRQMRALPWLEQILSKTSKTF
jgi:hypothetical protein